jgi:phosphatidylglycerophosphate synthase
MSTGLVSAYLTADPTSHGRLALAGVLWHMAAVLDRCDGEIARVKLAESKFGAWFDTITDNLAYFCMYGAITMGARRLHPAEPLYMYLAASAIAAMILSMVLLYSYAIKTGSGSLQNYLVGFREHVPEREKGWLYRALERYAFLAKRDSFSFMFMLAAVAGLFDVIYWVLVGGLHLIALGIVLSQRKMLASHPVAAGGALPADSAPAPVERRP